MTNGVGSTPSQLRRLRSPAATEMADLAAVFEDLQTTLRCCERLMAELAADPTAPEDRAVALEAFWTTALLSYARCFAPRENATHLSTDDVSATGLPGDVIGWHQMLLRLRDHYADPLENPREAFAVGVSRDAQGAADGVAVTSTRQPALDDVTVRQTGAIAYELARILDRRIAEAQQTVFAQLREMTKAELERLPVVEVVAEQ